ncbi:DUF1071 domain-containing protein [Butyricicoccus sp. AM29-23AC]|nr:DUF1071 domain-containing protein [Butyricicoccus sp. AM29-23AC]
MESLKCLAKSSCNAAIRESLEYVASLPKQIQRFFSKAFINFPPSHRRYNQSSSADQFCGLSAYIGRAWPCFLPRLCYTYAIMDFKNNAMKADQVTSTDANKAKMRALAKACAQFGLGLYIYEGEDMPEGVKKERTGLADARKKVVSAAQAAVKRGVDRTKIYELIAEKNNGHDSPTEIPTIALCEEIAAAIKNMKK